MSYKNSSYGNIARCPNCESVMAHHETFGGYEMLDCYPCGYSLDRRGHAFQHIVEIPVTKVK